MQKTLEGQNAYVKTGDSKSMKIDLNTGFTTYLRDATAVYLDILDLTYAAH